MCSFRCGCHPARRRVRKDFFNPAKLANPDVRGGGVSTDVAECKTAILRPTFRPTNRRLSASCVQWAVGPRWPMPRFRFWCFSTSVSRPTEKVFGFSISKHHQSTDPDGGPFGGCSGTSKTMGKHESPYGNRRFRVSGGAGTRGTGGGFAPPDPSEGPIFLNNSVITIIFYYFL